MSSVYSLHSLLHMLICSIGISRIVSSRREGIFVSLVCCNIISTWIVPGTSVGLNQISCFFFFLRFFLMWIILKVFIEFVTIFCFCFIFLAERHAEY